MQNGLSVVQLLQKFVRRSRARIFRNKCTRSTPMDLILLFCCICSVWVHLGPFCCFMLLGSKQAELLQLMQNLCHKVAIEFFATNPLDPHHRTLNSCFGAFRSVWVDLGSFLYCTKLCAKWAELVHLMQKFVPRSRFRISRNKRTRSTP